MSKGILAAVTALLAGGMVAGCANDGSLLAGGLTTASVTEPTSQVATPQQKVDPQCVALMSKIDALRKEGTPERIEKVSTGKGSTAQVKRESLAKITELDKANAEFQSRCSSLSTPQQAAVAPAVANQAVTQAATDAAAKAAVPAVQAAAPAAVAPASPATAAKQATKKTVAKAAKKAVKPVADKSAADAAAPVKQAAVAAPAAPTAAAAPKVAVPAAPAPVAKAVAPAAPAAAQKATAQIAVPAAQQAATTAAGKAAPSFGSATSIMAPTGSAVVVTTTSGQ